MAIFLHLICLRISYKLLDEGLHHHLRMFFVPLFLLLPLDHKLQEPPISMYPVTRKGRAHLGRDHPETVEGGVSGTERGWGGAMYAREGY